MIIYFYNTKKEYFSKVIFSGIRLKLSLEKSQKIGIVAKNGEGKTTLLKMIAGIEELDGGTIKIEPKRTRLFYISTDHINSASENKETTIENFLFNLNPYLGRLKDELNSYINDLNNPDTLNKYETLVDNYEKAQGYIWEEKIHSTLKKLNLIDKSLSTLSGGEKSRLILASIKLIDADLVLLDEPTNHLDIDALNDLEEYVKQDSKTYIIVSHDQSFLDNVTTKIITIESLKLKVYNGNYSFYKEQKELEEKQYLERYKESENEKDRLSKLAKKIIAKNQAGITKVVNGTTSKHFTNTQGIRVKVAPDKDKMAAHFFNQKLESRMRDARIVKDKISRMETLHKPKKDWGIKMDINTDGKSPDILLKSINVSIDFKTEEDKNLHFDFPDFQILKSEKVAIIGPNGIGKSTFAKIILGELIPASGEIVIPDSVTVGYYSQTHDNLHMEKRVIEDFLDFEKIEDFDVPVVRDARNFLHKMLFTGDMALQKVHELSQGEKSKLSLAKIIYKNPNFLILDEPTNHLDIPSKERLEEALKSYSGTLLVISHDRYFMESINIQRYVKF